MMRKIRKNNQFMMMKRINKKNLKIQKKNQNPMILRKNQKKNQNQMTPRMMMKFVYHNLERNQRKLLKES